MEKPGEPGYQAPVAPSVGGRSKASDDRLLAMSSLLDRLDEAAQADAMSHSERRDVHQEQLVQIRLGMAGSLFTALRAKHAPTAAHSLRVALGVSSWSLALDFTDEQRDLIEVAALLHDVGMIGVPDHVLMKPGKLSGEELRLMERRRQVGREIMHGCCASEALLDIVYYATAWYDGSRHGFDRRGEDLPLASRMIAIVDAFDAMTTDRVYRRAMPRERAIAELFEYAGSQFDSALAKSFCDLAGSNHVDFQAQVARRWLQQIDPNSANSFWSLQTNEATEMPDGMRYGFHDKLLDAMHDGVVFVDERLEVAMWNRAAERLTGITASGILHKQWEPALVRMRDERGNTITESECPVLQAMRSGIQILRRLSVAGRTNDQLSLDVHIAPVLSQAGQVQGAVLILHDASSQITQEERIQSLHEKATRDPLTKLANRAEFDRVFPLFVASHLEQRLPCSLIMCDIDHFKRINDTHGHQAGDEALRAFASMLKRHARTADLVARYGGEEFVVLCAGCDNANATRRAEEMCRHIGKTPQLSLSSQYITASFGVTEIQGGDTPETLLRRADRALLQAKDSGRNRVVQLGTAIAGPNTEQLQQGWLPWFRREPVETLLERSLITVVPLNVAAEKLRGFVADHHAEILSVEDNRVSLKIDGQHTPLLRRSNDRVVPFVIEMVFEEKETASDATTGGRHSRTLIHVTVRPKRQRDRRRRDAIERARQLLVSLKSYLMAHDYTETSRSLRAEDDGDNFLQRAKTVLSHWLGK
ncbi:MAG: diguanylate cyclase [Pirellulaceae bacterium]